MDTENLSHDTSAVWTDADNSFPETKSQPSTASSSVSNTFDTVIDLTTDQNDTSYDVNESRTHESLPTTKNHGVDISDLEELQTASNADLSVSHDDTDEIQEIEQDEFESVTKTATDKSKSIEITHGSDTSVEIEESNPASQNDLKEAIEEKDSDDDDFGGKNGNDSTVGNDHQGNTFDDNESFGNDNDSFGDNDEFGNTNNDSFDDDNDDDFGDFDDFDEFEDGAQDSSTFESQPTLPPVSIPSHVIPCLAESDFSNSARLQSSIEQILADQDIFSDSGSFLNTPVDRIHPSIGNDSLPRLVDSDLDESSGDLTDALSYTDTPRSTASDPDPLLSYFTVRSKSLWDQLAQAPMAGPQSALTDWNRSAIRRCFLVSLGVPVDLDQVMPQKEKQKRLILSAGVGKHEAHSGPNGDQAPRVSRHGHQASVYAVGKSDSQTEPAMHDHRRVQSSSGRMVGATSHTSSSRPSAGHEPGSGLETPESAREKEGREEREQDEAHLAEWSRLVSVSHLAIKNMTEHELHEYVKAAAVALDSVKSAHARWTARRDDALKDKAAFEGVIENLVDYAQRVGKNGTKKGKGLASASKSSSRSASGPNSPRVSTAAASPGPGHKKQSSTLGRANSILRKIKTDL